MIARWLFAVPIVCVVAAGCTPSAPSTPSDATVDDGRAVSPQDGGVDASSEAAGDDGSAPPVESGVDTSTLDAMRDERGGEDVGPSVDGGVDASRDTRCVIGVSAIGNCTL